MDDDAPAVRHDAAAGSCTCARAAKNSISLPAAGGFWQDGSDGRGGALWLSAEQADVLSKMIDYILQRVKISPPSQQALQALAPQVAQLRDELQAALAPAADAYYEEDDAGA